MLVAKASTLEDLGRQFVPAVHSQLVRAARFADTPDEARAIEDGYAAMPSANFSQAILGPCPPALVVSALPALTWCDWGTPERVLRSLERLGAAPSWAAAVQGLGGSVSKEYGAAPARVRAGDAHGAPT